MRSPKELHYRSERKVCLATRKRARLFDEVRDAIGLFFVNGARVGLFVHLVLAAACFGLTRAADAERFFVTLGITVAVWVIGWLVRGSWPRVGRLAPALAAALLVLGWGVTLLGFLDPSNDGSLAAPEWLADLALDGATFDLAASLAAMHRTTLLLAAMLMIIDLTTETLLHRLFLLTMALTAVGLSAYFLLQKSLPDVFQLRGLDGVTPLSFATYRYWGNGASFLNLMWPPLAAIALYAWGKRALGWSIWSGCALLVFSLLFLNVSKAGQVLGLLGLGLFALVGTAALVRSRRNALPVVSRRILVVIAVPAVVLGVALWTAVPWDRWRELGSADLGNYERFQLYRMFVKIVPEAGWLGFGPGSFEKVCRSYLTPEEVALQPYIWVAHQDYLQTGVEWGYLGSLLWAALLGLGFAGLLGGMQRKPGRSSGSDDGEYDFGVLGLVRKLGKALPPADNPVLLAGAFTAVFLTALHAGFDFPMQIPSLQLYLLTWIALGWRARLDRRRISPSEDGARWEE